VMSIAIATVMFSAILYAIHRPIFKLDTSVLGLTAMLHLRPGGEILMPRGHAMDFENWQLRCDKPGECSHPLDPGQGDWDEPFDCYVDLLGKVVDRYKPDILVQGVDNHIIQPYDWLIDIIGFTPDKQGTLCGMSWVDFGAALTRDLGTSSGGTRGEPLVLTRSNNAPQTVMLEVYDQNLPVSPTIDPNSDQVMYDVEYLTKLLAAPPLRGFPGNGGPLMKDGVHLMPWVNFELNMWMLNVIAANM